MKRPEDPLGIIESALCYFLERIPLDSVADERRVENAIEAVAALRASQLREMPTGVSEMVH